MSTTTTSSIASATSTEAVAQSSQGTSAVSFFTALAVSLVAFGVQIVVFELIRNKLARIYIPKTYLVAEREQTRPPDRKFLAWVKSIFTYRDAEIIRKCGLDAYFFLRYLQTLLIIFVPLALLILPILLPINYVNGKGTNTYSINGIPTNFNVSGLDVLAWGNVPPDHTHRYWAHLILAVIVVVWVCGVFFFELRVYIRIRQDYLTSAEHRLRASATTVLVSAIPQKWLTHKALDGLYDVFPGGIRNIWINRNFDGLLAKVKQRQKVLQQLEKAETKLIRLCKEEYQKQVAAEEKKRAKELKASGGKKQTKEEKERLAKEEDERANRAAQVEEGVSSGDPQEVKRTIDEAVASNDDDPTLNEDVRDHDRGLGFFKKVPILGGGLAAVGQGLGRGIDVVGNTFGKAGDTVIDGVKGVGGDINNQLETTNGFVNIDSPPQRSVANFPTNTQNSRVSSVGTSERNSQPTGLRQVSVDQPSVGTPERNSQPTGLRQVGSSARNSQPTGLRRVSVDNPSLGNPARNSQPTGLRRVSLDKSLPPPPRKEFDVSSSHPESSPVYDATNHYRATSETSLHNNDDPGFGQDKPLRIAPPSNKKVWWKFWQGPDFGYPSPLPHGFDDESEYPFAQSKDSKIKEVYEHLFRTGKNSNSESDADKNVEESEEVNGAMDPKYGQIYDPNYKEDIEGGAAWERYIKKKDRPTHRVARFKWLPDFLPCLPLISPSEDTIYSCRQKLARLNVEIAYDQKHPEEFPFMNSAFIQFNHQVAAHMAAQSVSHHIPRQMAPRTVEISPSDVLWDNMSIKWWESWLRTGVVIAIVGGIVILWSIPVAATSLLGNLPALISEYPWLAPLNNNETTKKAIAALGGVLPALVLGLLFILLPLVFKQLATMQGAKTGMQRELIVQHYYFFFIFVQVFFVVSVAGGTFATLSQTAQDITSVPHLLANNLPKASNYFFSYMILQATSTSVGNLIQWFTLFKWFIWAKLRDNTARQKWKRTTSVSTVNWGTYFPTYTMFACIALIYSVVSPLIIVFAIITFTLLWFSNRYSMLYIQRVKEDTGGLVYPRAINQTFTGLYIMELCLIGLFFIVEDDMGNSVCVPQAIIMIVVGVMTIIYQVLLDQSFSPLYRHLPITLEDDAVLRDEAFERMQAGNMESGEDGEEKNMIQGRQPDDLEMKRLSSSATDEPATNRYKAFDPRRAAMAGANWATRGAQNIHKNTLGLETAAMRRRRQRDLEAQLKLNKALFDFADEVEDLDASERDALVKKAFHHIALRSHKPTVWIPRDEMGVSDDEIKRTAAFSAGNIWISNEGTALDSKCRVVYGRNPPDFSSVDLIKL